MLELERFRCPDCRGGLRPGSGDAFASCGGCGRTFRHRAGVFDLAPTGCAALTMKTASQFGASWAIHDRLEDYHEPQFRDWIAPLAPADFAGKSVIEGGCGKGRHTRAMAAWGARSVTAFDLSDAIALAAANTAADDRVRCVRANLLDLPVADAGADLAVCVGVLHHLEHPEAGLRELWRALKPGGTLCLWVYGREGNGWLVWLIDPIRRGITSRIPTRALKPLVKPIAAFLFILVRLLYAPLTRSGARRVPWLPYSAYLGYISKFPYREIEHITLDHLCPPIALYLRRETLEGWFAELPDVAAVEYRWHNRNSWAVLARKRE